MKLKWNGPEANLPAEVAAHRDGNAVVREGDTFEVPEKLGKTLLRSSAHYEETKQVTNNE